MQTENTTKWVDGEITVDIDNNLVEITFLDEMLDCSIEEARGLLMALSAVLNREEV